MLKGFLYIKCLKNKFDGEFFIGLICCYSNSQFFTDCLCTGIYSCTARNKAGVVNREMVPDVFLVKNSWPGHAEPRL